MSFAGGFASPSNLDSEESAATDLEMSNVTLVDGPPKLLLFVEPPSPKLLLVDEPPKLIDEPPKLRPVLIVPRLRVDVSLIAPKSPRRVPMIP